MKRNKIWLVISLLVAIILPLEVKAAVKYVDDGTGKYVSDSNLSVGSYGTIKAGDGSWQYTPVGSDTKTWTFNLTPSGNFKYIYIILTPTNISIESITTGANYTQIAIISLENGQKGVLLQVKDPTSTDTSTLFKVTTTDTGDEGCTLNISPQYLNCSTKPIANHYFNANGEMITKADWDKVCSGGGSTPGTPSSPDTPDEPGEQVDTGIPVPYLFIGGGILLIAGIYFVSHKSKKMYKI